MMKVLATLIVSLCLAATALGQSAFSQGVQSALGTTGIGQNALAGAGNAVSNAVNSVVNNANAATSWNIPANSPFPSASTLSGNSIFQGTSQPIQTGNLFDNSITSGAMQNQVLFNTAGNAQGIPVNTMPMLNSANFNQGVPMVNNQQQFLMGGNSFSAGAPFVGPQTFSSTPFFNSGQTINTIPTFSQTTPVNAMFTGTPVMSGAESFLNFNQYPEVANNVPFSSTFFNPAPPMYDAMPPVSAFTPPIYDSMQMMGFQHAPMNTFSSAFNSMASTQPMNQLQAGQTVYCIPAPSGMNTIGKK